MSGIGDVVVNDNVDLLGKLSIDGDLYLEYDFTNNSIIQGAGYGLEITAYKSLTNNGVLDCRKTTMYGTST